jgi:hypothetical protein
MLQIYALAAHLANGKIRQFIATQDSGVSAFATKPARRNRCDGRHPAATPLPAPHRGFLIGAGIGADVKEVIDRHCTESQEIKLGTHATDFTGGNALKRSRKGGQFSF